LVIAENEDFIVQHQQILSREDLIPDEMQILIDEHHSKRPRSCKPLIDMTFAGNDHRDVAWNLLDDDEGRN